MRTFLVRFSRERWAVVGALLLLVLVLATVVGPFVDPYDPDAISHELMGSPVVPSFAHPLGTDVLGRDELARMLAGGRISLLVGFLAMAISISLGTLYGAIAGAAGGRLDAVMMRFVDALISFPSIFLIITVEALRNDFSLTTIVAILGLLSWMGVARLVRGQVLSLREREFVEAARALGADPRRILLRHLIPNALAPVVVAAAFAVGDNILAEAGLSFIGLGIQPPTASWGNMIGDSLVPDARPAWWLLASPGVAIAATLFAVSQIGDGLQAVFDRRLATGTAADREEELVASPRLAEIAVGSGVAP